MTFTRISRFLNDLLTRIRIVGKPITVVPSAVISWYSFLSCDGGGSISVGAKTRIHPYAMLLTYGGNISIGRHCTVNPYNILYGHGGLTIGDRVRIAAHCVIIPAQHRFNQSDTPIHEQGISAKGIFIEDDVWIGANCTILDGVRIGRGSVIGAGSVVTKSIEPNSVAVGVPARVIRTRE